jgi:hypothetical protein
LEKPGIGNVRTYHAAGDISEEVGFRDGTFRYRLLYSYDPDGKVVNVRYCVEKGNCYRTEAYSYIDGSDRVVRITTGDRVSTRECDHKVTGKTIDVVCVDPAGAFLARTVYDMMGNLLEKIFDQEGHISEYVLDDVFVYDAAGNLVERGFFREKWEGNEQWRRIPTMSRQMNVYDPTGNLLERTYYDDQDMIAQKIRYAYEFDSHGNWIKQTSSGWSIKDGKRQEDLPRVYFRTISYY